MVMVLFSKKDAQCYPRFLLSSYKGDYPQSAAAKDKKSAKEWLPTFLYSAESASNVNLVRQRLKFELFCEPRLNWPRFGRC